MLFQPLIIPPDRILRHPISPWQEKLCQELAHILSQGSDNLSDVAYCMNQLALLEAYQGNNANSLKLCETQIIFWKNWAKKNQQPELNCFTVQPSINIIRLDRWQNRLDRASSLYTELAPHVRNQRNAFNQQFGIEYNFEQLCQIDPANSLEAMLNSIYWIEYGQQLLASGDYAALQTHIQTGLAQTTGSNFIKYALLELLILYQSKIGKHEKALSLCVSVSNQFKPNTQNPSSLPFKALEMALHRQLGNEHAKVLLAQIFQTITDGQFIKKNGHGLHLLFELSRVCKDCNFPEQERQLLELAQQLALDLNDEVMAFEVMHRQAALQLFTPEQVLQRFHHSQYAVVQKKLGIQQSASHHQNAQHSHLIVEASQKMAELDFVACVATLKQAFPLGAVMPA